MSTADLLREAIANAAPEPHRVTMREADPDYYKGREDVEKALGLTGPKDIYDPNYGGIAPTSEDLDFFLREAMREHHKEQS